MENVRRYRVFISSRFGDFHQDVTIERIGFFQMNIKQEAEAIAKCVMGRVERIERL